MKTPFVRVLVAFDGSSPAKVALVSALSLGKLGAHIVVASVVDSSTVIVPDVITSGYDPTSLINALEADAESALASAASMAAEHGLQISTRVLRGKPVAQLTACAKEIGADLIAAGTHGRTGIERAFMGSTAAGLLRSATVPILVVRENTRPLSKDQPLGNLLVAVDNSGPADAAVELASSIAEATGARLLFLSVVDTRDIYEKAMTYGYDAAPLVRDARVDGDFTVRRALENARRSNTRDRELIEEGEPAATIVAVAKQNAIDAIVIGTHGRRGLERFFVGSVAEHVVRDSSVPVIVLRSSDAQPVRQEAVDRKRTQKLKPAYRVAGG